MGYYSVNQGKIERIRGNNHCFRVSTYCDELHSWTVKEFPIDPGREILAIKDALEYLNNQIMQLSM